MIGVAYGIAGLQVLFGLIWGMALLGVLYHSHQNFECDSYGGSCHITHVSAFGMIFMLLSYYWTTEVLKVRKNQSCMYQIFDTKQQDRLTIQYLILFFHL